MFLLAAALMLGGAAPMQCGEPEPIQYARRDDAAEIVWRLGNRLRERGHADAAAETWRFLVERYPSSRWAARARQELESIDADSANTSPSAATETTP